MKPYRVAVWIDNSYVPESGGGHSFLSQLVDSIDCTDYGRDIEIIFTGFNLRLKFKKESINIPYSESFLHRKKVNFYHKFLSISLPRRDVENNFSNAESILRQNKIDIIFYPTPDVFLANYPFILVNWDLGHRTTFPFPETAMFGNWEKREKKISESLHKALLICAESEEGKNEIIKNYNINPNKISILPLFPGKITNEKIQSTPPIWLDKNKKFFFYPAQFWAHKNHYNLILGFNSFVKKNNDFLLVLPGSDQGNMSYIKNLIKELGLEQKIILPGFITDEHLKWLYLNAVGVVFPSLLGPTNMPLLEAINLKCKIACSNLEGHKKMLEDSSIYFNALNPTSIEEALENLNQSLEKNNPYLYINPLYTLENAMSAFKKTIIKSISIRRTWGM